VSQARVFYLYALILLVALTGTSVAGLTAPDLAGGLFLLGAAVPLVIQLIRSSGGLGGSYGMAGLAIGATALEITLAFTGWSDVWLVTLTGFGASISAVVVAGIPFMDRLEVPDMSDDLTATGGPKRIEASPLDKAGRVYLLAYSQLVVMGNLLVTVYTVRVH
jgi:hypothetical protein